MRRYILGMITFLAEFGVIIFLSLFIKHSGDYTLRLLLLYFLFQIVFGQYRTGTLFIWEEVKLLIGSHFCFFMICIILTPFKESSGIYIIEDLVITCFMFVFSVLLAKFLRSILFARLGNHVLIIGTGREAGVFYRTCKTNRFSLMDVKGFVNISEDYVFENTKHKTEVEGLDTIYPLSEMLDKIDSLQIDQVIIAVPNISNKGMDYLLMMLQGHVNKIKYIPISDGVLNFDSKIDDFDGLLMISSSREPAVIFKRAMKRLIDICTGVIGCILLLPLSLFVKIVAIKNGDHDSIFFRQMRIGKHGEEFEMLKFRTMVPNAESVLDELMEKEAVLKEEYETHKKLKKDPRITKTGILLRKSSLDEFPQFLNVLSGKMSLVGPRPYLPREKNDMTHYYFSVIKSKPGITGMWQTHGRSDVMFQDRCKMDDYYCNNWSLWLDFTILIKTLKSVFCRIGAI